MNNFYLPYVVVFCLSLVISSVARPSTAFDKALRNGAEARVVVSVVDDDGHPVSNATVKAFFEMGLSDGSKSYEKETDGDGIVVLEGNVSRSIHFRVEKVGYYKSRDKVCLIEMGHEYEVRDGKWQPWGMKRLIFLRPKGTPRAMAPRLQGWRQTNVINKWIGFDVAVGDYVKPQGIGEVADFEVRFEWDGAWRNREYSGMSFEIRFVEKFAGGYYAKKCLQSEYPGVYVAKEMNDLVRDMKFYEKAIRDGQGCAIRWDESMFGENAVFVGRSRCSTREDGSLKEAMYFQFSDLRFACGQEGASFRMKAVYNPMPNDTNLEPKETFINF